MASRDLIGLVDWHLLVLFIGLFVVNLIVGSIANIIVVDQAAGLGVRIGWREHARVGIPVTLVTLALAAAWLVSRAR